MVPVKSAIKYIAYQVLAASVPVSSPPAPDVVKFSVKVDDTTIVMLLNASIAVPGEIVTDDTLAQFGRTP